MDFLTIGHVAKDLLSDGYTVGGTVTYASVTALQMGRRPGVVTRFGPDLRLPPIYDHIELLPLPSAETLTFELIYGPAGRRLVVHAQAGAIEAGDIPITWRRRSPIVLLGPLANEVSPAVATLFPNALLGVVPQGWMRRWNHRGEVFAKPWDSAPEILPHAGVLVLSYEDINHNLALADSYSRMVEIMVLTRGPEGCDVYRRGKITRVPPRPAQEVDPTGAGDVFAAAFLLHLSESGDPLAAARFGNVVASFSVEGQGYSAIPNRQQVEAWLAAHSPSAQVAIDSP